MTELVLIVALMSVSAVLTGGIRRYAVNYGLVDQPNERSSHEVPTPRGGGLAIVVTFLAFVVYLYIDGDMPLPVFLALVAGGGLVGVIGFLDDHGHVPAALRFAVHTLAAAGAVLLISPEIPVQIGDTVIQTGSIGKVLCIAAIAWSINLFNFMDGVDGIAGAEVVFVCFGAVLVGATAPAIAADGALQVDRVSLGLGSACLGFLLWNWPPAKIFMGDVGSGFIGFAVAALAVYSVALGTLPVWTWLILVGTFFVDATYTLIRRVTAGERWYEAHRSHAYQRAARRFGSHARVTVSSGAINVLWLLPLAWCSAYRPEWGIWLLLLAWLPLIATCRMLGAGRADDE